MEQMEPTNDDKIETIDMTTPFYQELESMIQKGEIIIININSKMRLGKSTAAISIAHHIFQLLKKYNMQPPNAQFGMQNIARDDQEYSRMMRNPRTSYTVIITDEENELEDTGENVTAEKALKKVFSDVQAGRYVHRICCSPKDIGDTNADILLSITGTNQTQKTTCAKLYYRFFEGGYEHQILLGYIQIPVGHIIQHWLQIKPIWDKHLHEGRPLNQQERTYFQQESQKDFYIEYIIKKYEKMELMTEHKIFRPRLLELATVINQGDEELKDLARIPGIIDADLVRNHILKLCRENENDNEMKTAIDTLKNKLSNEDKNN